MSDGFIDLRQNNIHLVEDSFWPSFTDIMTVVVMIFLITSSILIVKNWELVKELKSRIVAEQQISQRLKDSIAIHQKTSLELKESIAVQNKTFMELKNSIAVQQKTSLELKNSLNKRQEIAQKLQQSMAAERRTAENIKQTSEEKATLEETLTHTQSELSLLRLQLMQAKESAAERDKLIAEQDRQLIKMSAAQNKLNQTVQTTLAELSLSEQQLADTNQIKASLQGELKVTAKQLAQKEVTLNEQISLSEQQLIQMNTIKITFQNELENISKQLAGKESELLDQRASLTNQEEELKSLNLQNESYQDNISEYEKEVILAQQQHSILSNKYNELENKYNKLIKPSRSAIGKYVVEVRYEKLSGSSNIQFRQSEQDSYQKMSNDTLHKKLKKLKQQYKERLYVKIIIPDNSGLSYSEAWTFMVGILDKYDYYYQSIPLSAKETTSPSPTTK
ncbi:MAG: hypothetical protein KZQ83_05235 [gamma proteobacterium symbiont of Taylorina sp.]|nr:hypothetical protein [gamma proteobacterium symbiont of Taylorina sp.]